MNLNGGALVNLLCVGWILARWHALLPFGADAYVSWNADSCAGLLVALVAYLNVGKDLLNRGLGLAKNVAVAGAHAAAGAVDDVAGKADLP